MAIFEGWRDVSRHVIIRSRQGSYAVHIGRRYLSSKTTDSMFRQPEPCAVCSVSAGVSNLWPITIWEFANVRRANIFLLLRNINIHGQVK
jgi:hypothetical protein